MIYQVKRTSLALYMVSIFAVLGIGAAISLPIVGYFLHQSHPNIILMYGIPLMILGPLFKYFPPYISSVTVELQLTSEGLEQRWLKQFPFQKQPDITICWTEIVEYVYQPDSRYDHFKLYLRDGTRFHLVHNHDYNKDDFRLFLKDFAQQVERRNLDQHAHILVPSAIPE